MANQSPLREAANLAEQLSGPLDQSLLRSVTDTREAERINGERVLSW